MSEIVRPTRDGIHGREYISTSVDIGKKPSFLSFESDTTDFNLPPIISLPFPVIFDMPSEKHTLPKLDPFILETARQTGLIAVICSKTWDALKLDNKEEYLNNIAFFLEPDGPEIPKDLVSNRTRLIEIPDGKDVVQQCETTEKAFSELCCSCKDYRQWTNASTRVEELSNRALIRFIWLLI